MMVLRKLAVALLSAGVMLPGLSHALAVKELQTKSALGEPFRAEVELIELGDLTANEIKVSLASQEDFERMGIERGYFLTELRFEVEVNPAGRSLIRVSSSKPVVEPYLDFVVRIAWPGNARLQEVTALLDPPMVADSAPPAVEAPVVTAPAPVEAPVVEPAPVVDAPAVEGEAPPAPVLAEPGKTESAPQPQPEPAPADATAPTPAPVPPRPVPAVAPDTYRVQAGDTMSRIADRVRADGVTTSQAMVALQRANPAAFANNNINQLKRGQVLRVPSEAQMREVSAQEALASVREQAAAWQATAAKATAAPKPALEAAQVDATAKPVEKAPAPAPQPKAEVKLLGGQTGKAGTAAAGKEQGAAAKPEDARKLAQVKNLAESAKAEKEKLAGKVQTLDAQVKANDKKVELQNARVAELEAQLREQKARAEAAKAAKAEAAKPAEVAKPAEPADAAKPADAAAPAVADAAAQTPAQQADAAAPAASATPAQPAPAPKPVMVEEPVPEESLPLGMIGGGVAALLAVLGGGWWWNQRRRREQEEAEATLAELEGLDAEAGADSAAEFGSDDFAAAAAAQPSSLDELDDSWLNQPAAAPASAGADRVLADPLEEAEQYIAYERYPQAVGLLTKAVAASPDRADLRMKLLEVYAHLDDWSGFAAQESWFEHAGDLDALSRAEELKAGMTPPSAGGAAGGHDDSLDFLSAASGGNEMPSLEDLEMDFNAAPNVGASSPSLQAVKDDDLSFDLDGFDDAPAAAPAAPAKAEALDDLSFDLDADFTAAPAAPAAEESLDFSLEEEAPAPAKTSGGSLGELADLDAELDFAPAPAPAAAPAAAADDDLSFSLDDLELEQEPVSAPEVTLDEDFNLEGAAAADDAGELSDLDFADLESADLPGEELSAADLGGEIDLEAEAADAGLGDLAADFDSTLQLDAGAAPAPVAKAAPAADAGGDFGMDDEFDFLADTDENATKLDLARAYIDMGDMEGARDILQEVLSEGSSTQKDEAKGLLAQVG